MDKLKVKEAFKKELKYRPMDAPDAIVAVLVDNNNKPMHKKEIHKILYWYEYSTIGSTLSNLKRHGYTELTYSRDLPANGLGYHNLTKTFYETGCPC